MTTATAARTAVVVGAGQGIGRAVAMSFASTGFRVTLVGRTAAALEATAEAIIAAGGSASVFTADVSREGSLDVVARRLHDGLDVLVNCAGEALMSSFDDTTFAQWQAVIAANLTTCYVTTHALLPALRRSQNATIVIVASKVALRGYDVVAYSAAKSGALGFARSLAVALRTEHIRVAAVCPGPTDTPMRHRASPDMDPRLVISPETVATTVRWLADLPRGVSTGEILVQSELYD